MQCLGLRNPRLDPQGVITQLEKYEKRISTSFFVYEFKIGTPKHSKNIVQNIFEYKCFLSISYK